MLRVCKYPRFCVLIGVLIPLIVLVGVALINIGRINKSNNLYAEYIVDYVNKRLEIIEVIATGYSSSRDECDDTPFITASNQRVRWGIIAADPSIPFGTLVYIKHFNQYFEVQDRGGAIKGNRIDIWFPSKKEAFRFGIKKLKIVILKQKGGVR